jgi:hypothetical protein
VAVAAATDVNQSPMVLVLFLWITVVAVVAAAINVMISMDQPADSILQMIEVKKEN